MLKVIVPKIPKPLDVPTDPQAAWANGYRTASDAFELMLNELLPFMDVTQKAKLLNQKILN